MFGRLSNPTRLMLIDDRAPRRPHTDIGNKSKLKIWQIKTVPKNCLINELSGLTERYTVERMIAITKAKYKNTS